MALLPTSPGNQGTSQVIKKFQHTESQSVISGFRPCVSYWSLRAWFGPTHRAGDALILFYKYASLYYINSQNTCTFTLQSSLPSPGHMVILQVTYTTENSAAGNQCTAVMLYISSKTKFYIIIEMYGFSISATPFFCFFCFGNTVIHKVGTSAAILNT